MSTNAPTRRERLCGWLAGKLIVRAAKLARARGDFHEFDHLRAAVAVGNTGPRSHDDGCVLAAIPDLLARRQGVKP